MKKIIKIVSTIILLIVIMALIFIPVSFINPTQAGSGGTPTVIAHRGASGVAPENTLPAIDSALAAGVDCIEIDVHLSADGRVIVMHDETVDRTTDGSGRIDEMPSSEILKLDAGSWFSDAYAGTRVPELGEVIRHVNGRCTLLIEIKKKKNQYKGIEKEVVSLIQRHNAAGWCEVQSFNDQVLELIHISAPEIRLHKLIVFKYRLLPYAFDGRITRFSPEKYHYVKAINIHHRFLTDRLAESIHRSGKKIHLWGCREEEPCFPLQSGNYDGWITDYPARWKERLTQTR